MLHAMYDIINCIYRNCDMIPFTPKKQNHITRHNSRHSPKTYFMIHVHPKLYYYFTSLLRELFIRWTEPNTSEPIVLVMRLIEEVWR